MLVSSLLHPCLNLVIAPYHRGADAPNDCWCAHPSQESHTTIPATDRVVVCLSSHAGNVNQLRAFVGCC